MVLPLVKGWSLEKHLITKLFRREHLTQKEDLASFPGAVTSLKQRSHLTLSTKPQLIDWLALKCCRWLSRRRQRRYYETAKTSLEKELDVVQYIKNIRIFRNLLRLILSPRERKLIRMQSYKSVVSIDKKQSENSSDFDSDQYVNYIEGLAAAELTNRESILLDGIRSTKKNKETRSTESSLTIRH